MLQIRGEYVVDRKGHPKAVVLNLKEYERLLRLAQDGQDAAYIRKHRHEKLIPMEEVHRNLKKVGLA